MNGAFLLKFWKLTCSFSLRSKTDFVWIISRQFFTWYSNVFELEKHSKQNRQFFKSLFWSINTVWCFIFTTKSINGNIILFFYFCIVSFMNRNFMPLQLCCFSKSLSTFLIFAGFLFTGFNYLTKHHLKHSLSSF